MRGSLKRPFIKGAAGRALSPLLLAILLPAAPARGQDEGVATTPRAAVELFLHATRAGRYDEAKAVFPQGSSADATTARDLSAVIDDYLVVDLSRISDTPEGKSEDHLPANQEEIGRVPVSNGTEPIRMIRESSGRWVFTATTLSHVPVWFSNLPDRWIRDLLPDRLLRAGPREVLWWQWIALVPITLASMAFGWLLAFIFRAVLLPITRRGGREFDTRLIRGLKGPLLLLAAILVARVLTSFLFFTLPAQAFMASLLSVLALADFFWGVLRVIDISIEALRSSTFAKDRPERLALLPLFSKAAKAVLAVVAVVEVLQRLGYPAASLIAGLGIGGLAFALAAQKTVENLFGSVMLGIDQPFRPGDLVQFDTVTGVVESIGLRSTRIRTASRTIITMPNGRLSDMRIESFAPRDRMRIELTLSLVHSTSADQLRKILADIEAHLRSMPDVLAEGLSVYFTGVSTVSLDLTIGLAVNTRVDATFQKARQEILLRVLGIVEENGSALAVPVRSVQLVGQQSTESEKKTG